MFGVLLLLYASGVRQHKKEERQGDLGIGDISEDVASKIKKTRDSFRQRRKITVEDLTTGETEEIPAQPRVMAEKKQIDPLERKREYLMKKQTH